MKRNTFLLCLLLLCMQVANAQLTKGNWLVGGNGYLSSQSQNLRGVNVKGSNLRLSPNVGYFIADKFAAGARINFEINKLRYPGVVDNSTRYGIGPFLRYYLLNSEKRVNILTEAFYQYSKTTSDNSSSSDNTFRISAGPVIYFNSSVGLEFTLNYEYLKMPETDTDTKKFFLGIGFQIHLESNKNY